MKKKNPFLQDKTYLTLHTTSTVEKNFKNNLPKKAIKQKVKGINLWLQTSHHQSVKVKPTLYWSEV